MDAREFRELIEGAEGHHLDFKEQLGEQRDLAKDLVCFANADGGLIAIGVREDGPDEFSVVGVEDVETVSIAVDDTAYQHCRPPIPVVIETVVIDEATVVVLRVPRGSSRPYQTSSGHYYVRSGARCRGASQEELRSLFQRAGQLTFDETTVTGVSREDSMDADAFRTYVADHAPAAAGRPTESLQRDWRLVDQEGDMTVAGLLLFGRDPQQRLAHAYVANARVGGTDPGGEPIDTLRADGTIFEQLESVERFLRAHLHSSREITDFDDEAREELPLTALREIVVNALVHRDYVVTGPVRVHVYDDRVEVASPGPPPNSVDEDAMLSGVHVMRNPHLYTRLVMAGLVTDTGSGILRAGRLVQEATGRPLELRVSTTETVVILPRPMP